MANGVIESSDPFKDFITLGLGLRYLDPGVKNGISRSQTTNSSGDPGLLILCPWMLAAEKHIAKYVRDYRSLFPSTKILMYENQFRNMIWWPDRPQMRSLRPAVVVIRDYLKSCDASSRKPQILVHILSNGGSHGIVQLAQSYHESTGDLLPINALIIDSSPSLPSYTFGARAMSQGLAKTALSRVLWSIPIYLTLFLITLTNALGISESVLVKSWRVLNDPTGPFLSKTIPRAYIFSAQDVMVPKDEVLQHAASARQAVELNPEASAELIQCVEFVGSKHVNHLSLDAKKYWSTVMNTWKKVQQ